MMKLVLSTKSIKPIKTIKPIPMKTLKKNPHIHPVNSVLTDIISKKPTKSCGCGK